MYYSYELTLEVSPGVAKVVTIGLPGYFPSGEVILSGDNIVRGYRCMDSDGRVMDALDFRVGTAVIVDSHTEEDGDKSLK